MNAKFERVKKLEQMLQDRGVYLTWLNVSGDGRGVRVTQIGEKRKPTRWPRITFDGGPRDTAAWIGKKIAAGDQVAGLVGFDDVSELLPDELGEMLREAFVDGEERGVVMSLAKCGGDVGAAALATWLSTKKAMAGNHVYKTPSKLVTRGFDKFLTLLLLADVLNAQFPKLTEWDESFLDEAMA